MHHIDKSGTFVVSPLLLLSALPFLYPHHVVPHVLLSHSRPFATTNDQQHFANVTFLSPFVEGTVCPISFVKDVLVRSRALAISSSSSSLRAFARAAVISRALRNPPIHHPFIPVPCLISPSSLHSRRFAVMRPTSLAIPSSLLASAVDDHAPFSAQALLEMALPSVVSLFPSQ